MKQYEGYCPGATYENVYCKSKYVNKNIERVNCFLPVGSTTGWANFVLFAIVALESVRSKKFNFDPKSITSILLICLVESFY